MTTTSRMRDSILLSWMRARTFSVGSEREGPAREGGGELYGTDGDVGRLRNICGAALPTFVASARHGALPTRALRAVLAIRVYQGTMPSGAVQRRALGEVKCRQVDIISVRFILATNFGKQLAYQTQRQHESEFAHLLTLLLRQLLSQDPLIHHITKGSCERLAQFSGLKGYCMQRFVGNLRNTGSSATSGHASQALANRRTKRTSGSTSDSFLHSRSGKRTTRLARLGSHVLKRMHTNGVRILILQLLLTLFIELNANHILRVSKGTSTGQAQPVKSNDLCNIVLLKPSGHSMV
eukprot:1194912-Prorocentrum_minimum.AAC.5